MNYKLSLVSLFAASTGTFALQPAHADIIVNYNGGAQASETFYDGNILTNDLINGGQPSLASATTAANDGAASSGDLSHDLFLTNPAGDSLTFNLNLDPLTGGSATGYTVNQIQAISGWAGAGFAAQRFQLTIRTISNPLGTDYGTFENSVGAVNPGGDTVPQSSMTTLTDSTGTIATGVTSLTFTYTPVTSVTFGTVVREIDVSNIVAAPEPSTYVLVVGGLALLALCRRSAASKRAA